MLFSDPGSPVAESFRTLRATLDLRAGDDACKSFLVISSAPNEGKSFVAANLAVAMAAQTDQKILLIDADLRCPSMQVIFDLKSESGGFAEALLDGNGDLEGLILATGIDNLNIMPAGHRARNPAELLSSPSLAILLERFATVYDRIVIDVAPINAVADGLLLAPLADSLLLVARAGRTHRDTVNHSIQTLIEAGSPRTGWC